MWRLGEADMNKSTLITLVLVTSVILGYVYFNTGNRTETKGDTTRIEKADKRIVSEVNQPEKKKGLLDRSLMALDVSGDALQIAKQLMPFDEDTLEVVWEHEFGCYVLGAEKVPVQDQAENICGVGFLTAGSYDEALWMQKHGYPSQSQLALLQDDANRALVLELAHQNYLPAMTLVAIDDYNKGYYEDSASWALSVNAYSNKEKTFPYRIRGEALFAQDNMMIGNALTELKIAHILGDREAGYIYNRYLAGRTSLQQITMDNAYLYMSRVFGVLYEDFPSDPRPFRG